MADPMQRMSTARAAKPVVSSSRLPMMTDTAPAPARIGGRILEMAKQPKPDTGKTKRMSAFRKAAVPKPPRTRPDQQEPRTRPTTARAKGGYVRLRLRVDKSRVSVVGAKAVEGPLVESKLHGALAYEVTLGGKRLSAGAVPDAGEWRSFPAPKGRGEMAGHHTTRLDSYEVNVRVPKDEVSTTALPKLEIALYRPKEDVEVERVGPGPIGPQLQRELREVARMKGIRPTKLDKPLADEVRAAFKR